MRRLPPLLLLALLAACRGAGAPRPMTAADRDVESVSISRARESFLLTREPGGAWRVTPPGDAADADGAAALLAGLRALNPETRLSKDGAAYGLSDADATVVRVRGAGGRELYAARFGRNGLAGAVHMAAAGTEAYLGFGPPPELLGRGSEDWRERRLLGKPCADVALDAGRGWRPASKETAAVLCGLRATAVLPPLPGELAGLGSPFLRVRASSGSFAVGARLGGEFWLLVDGRAALLRAPSAPLTAAREEARR
jgi:hypothetical protein